MIICIHFIGQQSSWFWTMMQFFGIVITLIFIFIQVKIQNKQIVVQNEQLRDQVNINTVNILNSLNEQWWSTRMRRARRKSCLNYKKTAINVEEEAVLSFFENVSLFCDKKMINPEYIWETYSYYIERYWLVFKDNVETFQKLDSTYFDGFVRLKNQMERISKQKGITEHVITPQDLLIFVDSEKLCYTPKTT